MLIMESWQQYAVAIAVAVSVIVLSLMARSADKRTAQEDHDHSTLTVCIHDNEVIGRNGGAVRHPPTKQAEAREPIIVENRVENGFNSFIRDYVIPTFCLQRLRNQQFAVLFLSKYDECNIHKTEFGG